MYMEMVMALARSLNLSPNKTLIYALTCKFMQSSPLSRSVYVGADSTMYHIPVSCVVWPLWRTMCITTRTTRHIEQHIVRHNGIKLKRKGTRKTRGTTKKQKKLTKKITWCAHRQTTRTASAFFGFNDFCFSFHQTKRTSTGEITRNFCPSVHTSARIERVSGTKEANAAKNRYTQIDGTRLRVVITVSTEHTHTQQRRRRKTKRREYFDDVLR